MPVVAGGGALSACARKTDRLKLINQTARESRVVLFYVILNGRIGGALYISTPVGNLHPANPTPLRGVKARGTQTPNRRAANRRRITVTDPDVPGCVACCKMPTDGALCRALVLVLLADAPGTRSGGTDALALLLRNRRRVPERSALATRFSPAKIA